MGDTGSTDSAGAYEGLTVEACYAAGLQALHSDKLEEAARWAAQCDAVRYEETDTRCAVLHGLIAAETGNLDAAITHLRHAAQLAPLDVPVARRLSEALIERGDLNEAVAALEQVATGTPEDADLLVDIGYLSLISNDRAKARATLERAATLKPEDAAIQYSLAQMYETLGEPARAAAILLPIARHTLSPRLLNELTLLLLQLGQWDEAETSFVSLQRLDPEHELIAQHGRVWCRVEKRDWRGAFDLALEATRLDRYELTTALLTYIKDQLFGQAANQEAREAELDRRVMAELREHAELHSGEDIAGGTAFDKGGDHD